MFRPHLLPRVKPSCRYGINIARQRRWFSEPRRPYDPLRIIFCGADEFSIYSLRAVHQLQQQKPDSIASIDVVCRPDKRVGRGLKQIQEVPIKGVAKELALPVHQIDTFTGWSPPSPADLIIAVSFGLLVPSRILKGATYGGLNVHPSMLPDLRGPAPLQHAIMKGRTHTGVTLQTMHPTRFDHGMIIAQTSEPGMAVPEDCTPGDLIKSLGPLGAELLSRGIEDGLFVSPTSTVGCGAGEGQYEHAPKITPEDRHIDWNTWPADKILRYDRALGRLWDTTTYQQCLPQKTRGPKRITFEGPWRSKAESEVQSTEVDAAPGKPTVCRIEGSRTPALALKTADGQLLSPAAATTEGEQKGKALPGLVQALRAAQKSSN